MVHFEEALKLYQVWYGPVSRGSFGSGTCVLIWVFYAFCLVSQPSNVRVCVDPWNGRFTGASFF